MFDFKEGFRVIYTLAVVGMTAILSVGLWLSYQAIVWLGEWLHILATR